MVKQSMVHPYHRIPVSNEKERTIDTFNDLAESPKNFAGKKKEKLIPGTYHMIPFI